MTAFLKHGENVPWEALSADLDKQEAEAASDQTAGVWCSKLSFPNQFLRKE